MRLYKALTCHNALWTGGALTTYAVPCMSLEQPEWVSDKQTYYRALTDQSPGWPAHSKDNRCYFIDLLISPNSLYFVLLIGFLFLSLPLLSHFFISFWTMPKVKRFLPPWRQSTISTDNCLFFFTSLWIPLWNQTRFLDNSEHALLVCLF